MTPVMDDEAVGWLLSSSEPAVRLMTRRDLLGEDISTDEVAR